MLEGAAPLDFPTQQKLIDAAGRLDIARLSNHGEVIIERRAPEVLMGAARVRPPPGGFLQATLEGERILAGIGAATPCRARAASPTYFAAPAPLRCALAARHDVHAVEIDRPALAALSPTPPAKRAACAPSRREARDLFHRPLGRDELKGASTP